MVRTVNITEVTEGTVYVDNAGRHMVEAVRTVRGQIAANIDGFWNYFDAADMVNIFVS